MRADSIVTLEKAEETAYNKMDQMMYAYALMQPGLDSVHIRGNVNRMTSDQEAAMIVKRVY